MGNQLYLDAANNKWVLREAQAADGGMPEPSGGPLMNASLGPPLGTGHADVGTALQSNTFETGLDLLPFLFDLPPANLDTGDKILGTSSLVLNVASNSSDYLWTPHNLSLIHI